MLRFVSTADEQLDDKRNRIPVTAELSDGKSGILFFCKGYLYQTTRGR